LKIGVVPKVLHKKSHFSHRYPACIVKERRPVKK